MASLKSTPCAFSIVDMTPLSQWAVCWWWKLFIIIHIQELKLRLLSLSKH